jgi:hypothetical protein
MPGHAICQTVAGASEFTGLVGAGLFSFSGLDNLPETTRVVLTAVAYATAIGDAGDVSIIVRRRGGTATERMLLGRGIEADITGPAGDGDYKIDGQVIPREPLGAHWDLVVTTSGKQITGTVCIDYLLAPYADAEGT